MYAGFIFSKDEPMKNARKIVLVAFAAAVLPSIAIIPAQTDKPAPGFNYEDYAAVLKTHVNSNGMVNYKLLKSNRQQLDSFIAAMGRIEQTSYEKWDDNRKIAFWINAYNSLTLKAIIDNYPIKSSFLKSMRYPKNSIRQIDGVWKKLKFNVMGTKISLDHIEHKILRKQFNTPGIHVALVCAAMGCPPLRKEPYLASKLDKQLADQAVKFLKDPAKFKIDRGNRAVNLSAIFKWFQRDFTAKYELSSDQSGPLNKYSKDTKATLSFISKHLSESDAEYILSGRFRLTYLAYDWSLNEQKPPKKAPGNAK
jgi:hypothetical protein